jgi:hypothetical protein
MEHRSQEEATSSVEGAMHEHKIRRRRRIVEMGKDKISLADEEEADR